MDIFIYFVVIYIFMHTTTRDIRDTVEDLDFITRKYLLTTSSPKKRKWKTYEQQLARRIRTAVTELTPLIREAVETIEIIHYEKRGRKPSIDLETKVKHSL